MLESINSIFEGYLNQEINLIFKTLQPLRELDIFQHSFSLLGDEHRK